MNAASRARLARAREVAAVYAAHPAVYAVILGGSTARGDARDDSDIDLGLFWDPLVDDAGRARLIEEAGAALERWMDNALRFAAGNPRGRGCIEIITLAATPARPAVTVDLEHESVAGTTAVLDAVLNDGELSLEYQELLHVLSTGIPLAGHDLLAGWGARAAAYPTPLAEKMVAGQIRGVGRRLLRQLKWAERGEYFSLCEERLAVGRQLLLALLGLNRQWAFTDNPDFKGFGAVVAALPLKPPGFTGRLGEALGGDGRTAARRLADLTADVLALVETHLPGVETGAERALLKQL